MLIEQKKRIALVAHDNKKQDLLDWARWNRSLLIEHELYATGTTGKLLEQVLGTTVHRFQSGPLGGDQQIGAKIAEGDHRLHDLFLGPSLTAASRHGCESPAADCRGLEYSGSLQSRLRRLHDLIDSDDRPI